MARAPLQNIEGLAGQKGFAKWLRCMPLSSSLKAGVEMVALTTNATHVERTTAQKVQKIPMSGSPQQYRLKGYGQS